MAQIHGGLARGLREAVKALDRREAYFCVLAKDCNEEAYKTLIEGLCKEHGIEILEIDSKKKLAEWVGICKYDRDMTVKKVGKCSCCVVKDYGMESPAFNVVMDSLNKQE